ncbi:hypothetical protein SDC9_76135 [bioreactor metagenome]|uniref:Uncharacterized protein n=1 Tax=bioreactor metagenome TaxID=1076179 RepID=A0A644YLY1_9ZZZZ
MLGEVLRLALVGELELVLQVVEPVVHRGRREHEDLGLHAFLDDLTHEALVARLLLFRVVGVAEVVGLVDHHQVVVAPVDTGQIQAERFTLRPRQVGMREDVVGEAILTEEVGGVVGVVVRPVLRQLFGTQHQHGLVAQLVILDDGQRGERLAQTDRVGEDAAVVGFQLVDDSRGGVVLEVVQALPDLGLLVAGAVVGENIVVDVVKEVGEQVVEDEEVDALWGVLRVHRCDVVTDRLRDVIELIRVVPDLVEQGKERLGLSRALELGDDVGDCRALLVS